MAVIPVVEKQRQDNSESKPQPWLQSEVEASLRGWGLEHLQHTIQASLALAPGLLSLCF